MDFFVFAKKRGSSKRIDVHLKDSECIRVLHNHKLMLMNHCMTANSQVHLLQNFTKYLINHNTAGT